MPAITISRQYASGGSDIAKLLATQLGWTVVDNQFVDRVADLAGVPAASVAQHEERVPGLLERVARALAIASPEVFIATGEAPVTGPTEDERLVHLTERVITEAVQSHNVILVGRGAQAYLAERSRTLHVYIVASRDVRIEAAMRRLGVDRAAAEHKLDELDEGRRRYVRLHYDRDWADAANYHLVVNSGEFGYEGTAKLIAQAAAIRGLVEK